MRHRIPPVCQRVLSPTMLSCLYTKAIAGKNDPRQTVPFQPGIPNEQTRLMLAQHVFEEAMETIHALGFNVYQDDTPVACDKEELQRVLIQADYRESYITLDEIIDGACDTIFVSTNVLVACGVPDIPHMQLVCDANDAKFPGGVAITDATGKYRKPEGWIPPDHNSQIIARAPCLSVVANHLVQAAAARQTFVSNTPPEEVK